MLRLKEKIRKTDILGFETMVNEEDEFEIPQLVLCKTPNPEEMQRRKVISSLRKQYGIRIEDTSAVV